MLRPLLCVLVGSALACSGQPTSMQEPASCEPLVDSLRPAAELGELGNLSFRFFNYDDDGQSSGATDFELAAGGSRTVAALQGRTAVPAGLTVRSTAPEIGDVALVAGIGTPNADWKTGCHALNVVHVTANQVGAFDVVVEDEAGAVFDRKTFQSVASEHLGVTNAWPAPGFVLLNEPQLVHATTFGPQGEILRGTGAVQFSVDGIVEQTDEPAGSYSEGDKLWFRAQSVGSGHVLAVSGPLREEALVTGITPDQIDDVALVAGSKFTNSDGVSVVTVNALATRQASAVAGFRCSWSGGPSPVDGYASALGAPAAVDHFPAPSTPTTYTCAVPGGPSRSIVLAP